MLLLQARVPGDPVRGEELRSFAERAGLPVECFEPWDLLAGVPSADHVRRFDAVMMGGSGDFYVSRGNLPSHEDLLEILVGLVDRKVPTFASCFGFQYLVSALEGEVVHDPGRTEVGTYELWLTEEGRRDPLFGQLPERFWAQLGRKDRAARLPRGVENLAASESCPYQALRVRGRPIWASQFHPELDGESNRRRFFVYRKGYVPSLGPAELEEAAARFRDSPHASTLLRRFVELVFGR